MLTASLSPPHSISNWTLGPAGEEEGQLALTRCSPMSSRSPEENNPQRHGLYGKTACLTHQRQSHEKSRELTAQALQACVTIQMSEYFSHL